MDDHRLSVYLGEIFTQCQYALAAAAQAHRMMEALDQRSPGPGNPTTRTAQGELFRALHSLLTHASIVSRLLWPVAKGSSAEAQFRANRGAALRQVLALSDDHPLKSRSLRNHLEHFDERLDHWSLNSKHEGFAQDNIGPAGILGMDEGDVMRWFDPADRRFIFRGESYDLNNIVSALQDLCPQARKAATEAFAQD